MNDDDDHFNQARSKSPLSKKHMVDLGEFDDNSDRNHHYDVDLLIGDDNAEHDLVTIDSSPFKSNDLNTASSSGNVRKKQLKLTKMMNMVKVNSGEDRSKPINSHGANESRISYERSSAGQGK